MSKILRNKIENMILTTVKMMEPEGTNHKRYAEMFKSMSDTDFNKYMHDLKSGKKTLNFFVPNLEIVVKQDNLKKAAEHVGATIFSKVTVKDSVTGIKYTTPQPLMILTLPVRRTRQFLTHGLSVPQGMHRTDTLTGQVVKPNQASRFSDVEMHLLNGRGMTKTITEYMKIRGGDISAYNEFRQQLEETGECSQSGLDPNTVTRSSMVSSLILKCMGIDNNQVDGTTTNPDQ